MPKARQSSKRGDDVEPYSEQWLNRIGVKPSSELYHEYRCGNCDIQIYIRINAKGKVTDGTALQGKHLLGRTLKDVEDWLYVMASNIDDAGVFIERINRQSGQNLS